MFYLRSHLTILEEAVLNIAKGQQEDSGITVLATKPDNLCLIPRVHMGEGEDWPPQVVFWRFQVHPRSTH